MLHSSNRVLCGALATQHKKTRNNRNTDGDDHANTNDNNIHTHNDGKDNIDTNRNNHRNRKSGRQRNTNKTLTS